MPPLRSSSFPVLHNHLSTGGSGATSANHGATCACGERPAVGVMLGLRSGTRPRLDGRWLCRKSCLRAALVDRARRDFTDAMTNPSRLRHRVPIGLLLQARGVVTANDVQRALQIQTVTKQRLGMILQEKFGVTEEKVTEAIAAQWNLPVLHLSPPKAETLRLFAPAPVFQNSRCFPAEQTPTRLLLACSEGPDPALAFALERIFPLRVEFGVVPTSTFESWRNASWESLNSVQQVTCNDREAAADQAVETLQSMQPVDSKVARVGKMWWMRMWLEDAARQQSVSDDIKDVLYSVTNV